MWSIYILIFISGTAVSDVYSEHVQKKLMKTDCTQRLYIFYSMNSLMIKLFSVSEIACNSMIFFIFTMKLLDSLKKIIKVYQVVITRKYVAIEKNSCVTNF